MYNTNADVFVCVSVTAPTKRLRRDFMPIEDPGGYERFDLRRTLSSIRISSDKLIQIVAWRGLPFFMILYYIYIYIYIYI